MVMETYLHGIQGAVGLFPELNEYLLPENNPERKRVGAYSLARACAIGSQNAARELQRIIDETVDPEMLKHIIDGLPFTTYSGGREAKKPLQQIILKNTHPDSTRLALRVLTVQTMATLSSPNR